MHEMRAHAVRTNTKDGELMMKNSDMPAMPAESIDMNTIRSDQLDESGRYLICRGITKREMFAMAAMQGLCAHSGDYHEFEHLAADAVNYADAVLKMLEVK